MKKQEAVNWAVSKLGKRLTAGQSNGAQCATFVIEFLKEHYNVHPTGNARDFIDFKYPKGFQVIKGKKQILQPGDIFVLGGDQFGHTGLVTEANSEYFNSIDQNWYNANLDVGSPAALVEDHVYTNLLGVIRPPYSDAVKGAGKVSTKIKTINETINYKMANRVGNVKGVVIHNTAGSATALQDYNNLKNASVSRYTAGVAHYYIDRKTVWRAIDTYSVAWHVADANGNNGYIGYEVNESMSASNKDFMANEQATFKKAALDMLYYGLPVNRTTVKLHCEFVPTACPHRSMALHADWDPVTQGAAPQSVVNKLKDYFIAQIKKYYDNPALKAGAPANDKVPTKDTKPNTKPDNKAVENKKEIVKPAKGWQVNADGVKYMEEHGTFTCKSKIGIVTRLNGPYTGHPQAGLLRYNESVDYSEKQVYDGHVWISWDTYGGYTVYMPVRQIDENGKQGELWGVIS